MKNSVYKLAFLSLLSTLLFNCSSEKEIAKTLPQLSTTTATNITLTSATSGGNITADGGAAVTARGVVWNTATVPTISLTTKTTDGSGTGNFSSAIASLTPSTNYYARAYATNSVGTGYGNEITFTTGAVILPTLTTTAVASITTNSAITGGTITADGGGAITARGVVWSTTQNPTIALTTKTTDGSGTGAYTSNLSNLIPNTIYYLRAYATNSAGTTYGNQISFTTSTINYATMYPTGTVFCYDSGVKVVTAIVDVTNPMTGKIWMDRNLGANRVATSNKDFSAMGDLFQWGRRADGHQCRNTLENLSGVTTTTLSNTDIPQHSYFIYSTTYGDWRNPQNDNLWQGVNGVNNPCPNGYRIPTATELQLEYQSWNAANLIGAFASSLKFTTTGIRSVQDSNLGVNIDSGYYWSSTSRSGGSMALLYNSTGQTGIYQMGRSDGLSIRCIKN
jgi:hypothetical protein